MSALITIEFIVPAGYVSGDYAELHGNGGLGGDINWDEPIANDIYLLFPDGAGLYGWGYAPWGNFRWGKIHSMNCDGWGLLAWGHFPWGHGTGVIKAEYEVETCGRYKFGLACYDELGNLHEGVPEKVEVEIHIAPPPTTGLKKNSYDKNTDILILDID